MILGKTCAQIVGCGCYWYSTNTRFGAFRKWLVMKKVTRYEYEKQLHPELNELQLQKFVTEKGSDYIGLLARHTDYHGLLNQITSHLGNCGVQYEVATRSGCTDELIDWADIIMTVGGDGTFLLAAGKVKGQDKPLVGINSDTRRSEGYLCLSKHHSKNFVTSIDRLLAGKYSVMKRQRIRMEMSGRHVHEDPVDIHEQKMLYPEYRQWEHVKEDENHNRRSLMSPNGPPRVLPILALNDVFIGESISARVSFYHVSVDHSPRVKQKSSGITVCTGTGSTSWFFNINQIPKYSIKEILKIAGEIGNVKCPADNEHYLRQISDRFHMSLAFSPEDRKMGYCIRDPVMNGIFKDSFSVVRQRGFCHRMQVKSRMWDAWVVVDGSLSFKFNDGALLELYMREEDALPCIYLQ